jgi:2-iminobutanoate/2-iminopropanoate deaminase
MKGLDEPFLVSDVPLNMHTEVNGVIYVSGHIPLDDDGYFVGGTVGPQTTRVLQNIEKLLHSIGSSKNEIVKTTVYLAAAKRDFDEMNAAYQAFFGDHRPARTTCGVELAVDVLVEIEAIAVRGSAVE